MARSAKEQAVQRRNKQRSINNYCPSDEVKPQNSAEPRMNPWSYTALLLLAPAAVAQTLTLKPDADLNGIDAPDSANRAFTPSVQIEKPGSAGVLAAQSGQANGRSLFIQNDRLRFVMNRENERSELASDDGTFKSAKIIKATVGPRAWVKLFADEECRRPLFPLRDQSMQDRLHPGVALHIPKNEVAVELPVGPAPAQGFCGPGHGIGVTDTRGHWGFVVGAEFA
jgi:hypothetical protein